MPVIKVNGKPQPTSRTTNNEPDPSGMKIWVILPGKNHDQESFLLIMKEICNSLLKSKEDYLPKYDGSHPIS